MSAALIKECLVINESIVIGPYDKIEDLSNCFKVCIGNKYGICSIDGYEILPIEWNFIDNFSEFPSILRLWNESCRCGIFSLKTGFILEPVYRHVRVRADDYFEVVDDENRHYSIDLQA